nr:uncharacterized protein LOC129263970 [Lytechinus pictus]
MKKINQSHIDVRYIFTSTIPTIHALAVQPELPRTVLEVQDFWKTSSYLIAGQVYSLDDIEHGILRRNKPHPSTKKCCFHDDDPRLAYIVDTLDARIHFALNCGAESCPPISVYTEQNLERALDMAAKNYLNQEITVDIDSKQMLSFCHDRLNKPKVE